MLRLNLGCGAKRLDGFINVDLADGAYKVQPDVVCDAFGPLPFATATVDEVHAYHVAEHCYRWQIEGVLSEWTRVLKPGGLLVLELPCLDKVIHIFKIAAEMRKPPPVNLTMWGLFGDPGWKNPAMCHRWAYSIGEMTDLMEAAGLTVESKEPQTHVKVRDMRLEGIKHGTTL
jgi:predicted SAM-dependent methyltransferase